MMVLNELRATGDTCSHESCLQQHALALVVGCLVVSHRPHLLIWGGRPALMRVTASATSVANPSSPSTAEQIREGGQA
jgi:hypothetical protein